MNKKIITMIALLAVGSLALTGCSSKKEVTKTDILNTQGSSESTIDDSNNKSEEATTTPENEFAEYISADALDLKSTDTAIRTASEFAQHGIESIASRVTDAEALKYLNDTFIPAHPDVQIVNNSKTNAAVVYFTSGASKACTTITFKDSALKEPTVVVIGSKDIKLCTEAEAMFKNPIPKK
jgi:hypothetical protein